MSQCANSIRICPAQRVSVVSPHRPFPTVVTGLNEALLVKASAAKLLRTDKVRADTTVIAAAVKYPTDSGLLAKAIGTMARTVARIKAAGAATRTQGRNRRRSAGRQRARDRGEARTAKSSATR